MPYRKARLLSRGSLIALGLIILAVFVGEAPIVITAASVHMVVEQAIGLSPLPSFLIEWAACSFIIGMGGYFLFGWPILKAYEQGQASTLPQSDIRVRLAKKLMTRGRVLSFLAASALGGALVVAWWSGSHRAPHARAQTMAGAWILSTTASGYWLGLLVPAYRTWGLAYVVTLIVIGVAAMVVHPKRYGSKSKLNVWYILGFLYNGLFAIRPHRDLLVQVAAELRPDERVLDAGCGTGWLARFASPDCEITGIDFSSSMLRWARRRPYRGVAQGDIARLPYEAGSFDVVVLIHALYTHPDRTAVIGEAHRVLKKGGRVILVDPVSDRLSPLWAEHRRVASARDNVRLFLSLPRIIAWGCVLSVRSLMASSTFVYSSAEDLQGEVTSGGFGLASRQPCYAGISQFIIGAKP